MIMIEDRKTDMASGTPNMNGYEQLLLVEDNRGDARMVELYLQESDLRLTVTNVPTLHEAIACAESVRFDVAIVDLGLPDSFGLDTFHRLHDALDGTVPIVVLSGMGDDSVAVAAVAAGAQDYLRKNDLSAEVLARTIRYAMERHRLRRWAEQVERLAGLGRLAATMAHEFNNVLMGILPWAQIISMSAAGNRQLEQAAAHVMDAVARGKRITLQVLDYARPSEPKNAVFDAGAWLVATAEELQPTLRNAGDLLVSVPPEPVFIHGDRAQLTQVVTNLVRNADDAGVDNDPIRLTLTQASETSVEIAVADQGTGVPLADRGKIFEPLFSTKPKGTGLGLAIVFQIVRAHGGAIAVESNQPRGSRFVVSLPPAHAVTAPADEPHEVAPRLGRVLIVDDEPGAAEGMKLLMEATADEVRIAGTGRDALAEVPLFDPDLLVLDVGLPDMSGIDVFHQLERRPPLIVFATGHVQRRDIEPLLGRHVGHLTKPYSLDDLWRTVKALQAG